MTTKTDRETALREIRDYLAASGCDVSGPNGSAPGLLRAAADRLAEHGSAKWRQESGEEADSPEDLDYLRRLLLDAQEREAVQS
jgi:hypothetical protein